MWTDLLTHAKLASYAKHSQDQVQFFDRKLYSYAKIAMRMQSKIYLPTQIYQLQHI